MPNFSRNILNSLGSSVKGMSCVYSVTSVGSQSYTFKDKYPFAIAIGIGCSTVGPSVSVTSNKTMTHLGGFTMADTGTSRRTPVTMKTINDLCRILNCRIEDIARYVPSEEDQIL